MSNVYAKVTEPERDGWPFTVSFGLPRTAVTMYEGKDAYAFAHHLNEAFAAGQRVGPKSVLPPPPSPDATHVTTLGGSLPTTWEIWCEGYRSQGNHGQAFRMGTVKALTFAGACASFFKTSSFEKNFFNPDNLTYWGCRLFDSEHKARRAHG